MRKWRFIASLITFLILTSCGVMQQDCTALLDDRDEYRNCMAAQGNQNAQYELGMAAFEGGDYGTAINWFKRAAKPRATQGPLYLEPEPGKRHDLYFEEDQKPQLPGHRGAQRMLVRIYEEGVGVPVDLKQAEYYREMINRL